MNTVIESLNLWGSRFTGFAVPMLVQSSILIALLLILDLFLRKKVRAIIRYALWMLVLVKLILPPSFALPTGAAYWVSDQLPSLPVVKNTTSVDPAKTATITVPLPDVTLPPLSTPPPHSFPILTPQAILFLAWLAGVIGLTFWVFGRCRLVVGMINQTTPAPAVLHELMESCRKQLGIKQVIPVRCASEANSPAICGLLHPVIIIPSFLTESLTQSEMRSVLLHELAHFKRDDLWVSHAQTFLQIIYWYNPLLWLANAVIRRTREQAVDELVLVELREEAENYSVTLVGIAKLTFKRAPLSIGLVAIVEQGSALKQRIRHIVDHPLPRTARIGIHGLLLILLVALMSLPMAAQRRPVVSAQRNEPGVSPPKVSIPNPGDRDEAMKGSRLSPQQAEELEAKLIKDPEDLSARNQLLGYYFMKRHFNDPARKARQNHILWLIEHHPEAVPHPYADLDPHLDGSVYEKAKALWLGQVKDNPKNTVILGGAAAFCLLHDRTTAEDLYKRAQALEPKNPWWSERLAHLYALDGNSSKADAEKKAAARKAWEQMERAQANTTNELQRFYNLDYLAQMAFNAGEIEKARTYSNEMLQQTTREESGWSYGDAIYRGNLILGRIALREGRIDDAKKHLLEAGKTTGSPVLGSFGPNMSLAKELLEKGEKETVLEFFKLCAKFWKRDTLDEWTRQVNEGKMPDFGTNLIY